MVDEKIREFIAEVSEDAVVFDDPAFDHSIVGLSTDGRVIYEYDDMVAELAKDDNIEETDAIDFIDYNTLRALSYENFRRENAPVIIDSYTREEIEARREYGKH
jgi:hypothetical protein